MILSKYGKILTSVNDGWYVRGCDSLVLFITSIYSRHDIKIKTHLLATTTQPSELQKLNRWWPRRRLVRMQSAWNRCARGDASLSPPLSGLCPSACLWASGRPALRASGAEWQQQGRSRSQCPGTAPQCQDARTPLRIFPTRPRVESIAPGWDLQTCLLVLPNPTDSQEEHMSVWPGDHEGRCSQTGASGSTTFLARLPRGWGPELRPRGLTGGLGICHRVTAPHFLCKCIVRQAPRVPVLQCLPCSTPESTARQILFS